jgi:hypothetical protein
MYFNEERYPDLYNLKKTVDIPLELYKSTIGEYFIGYADNLTLGPGTSAWARLYNPPWSGVNLHVNVWTVTAISNVPYRAQFWFNAIPPGTPAELSMGTPSNTAIYPPPKPKVKIQQASEVPGEPIDGVKAFVRRGLPEVTLAETENGKLIFPPGGSFLVFVTFAETPEATGGGRIAFGWYEEPLPGRCT